MKPNDRTLSERKGLHLFFTFICYRVPLILTIIVILILPTALTGSTTASAPPGFVYESAPANQHSLAETVRAQLVNSHNGKILRVDPLTGAGVPSNPFYDLFSPHSEISVAPVINNVSPTIGLYTTNRYTSFSADLSDNIRLKNAELRLDEQVVKTWILGQVSQTVSYPRTTALSYGWHTYALNVWDPSNNLASTTRSFYVYSSGGGGGGCFLAGTPISMGDLTTRPIEKVSVGETVIAYDKETGRLRPGKVSHVIEIVDQKDYLLINGFLKVTSEHRFLSDGHWVKAGQLRVGESNITDMENVSAPVMSIEHVAGNFTVYNLEIEPYHTFIANGVIVHNGQVKQTLALSNNVIIAK